MPDRYEYLAHLIIGYLRQELTVEERAALEAWLAERAENQRFFDELEDTQHLQQKLQVFHVIDRERLWALTQSKLSDVGYESAARPVRRIGRWLPYAAALLLGVIATAWFFFDKQPASEPLIVNQEAIDILPGGNRAMLTLADGRTITLDETRDGIVIDNDEITYNDGNPLAEVEKREEVALLELSTPKGGTYKITLPDGTQVWLNAASTLRYPSRFGGGERIVELDGEAYFEVKSDSTHPFKVKSNEQYVSVLGTEFNISAYHDELETQTTLIEGSIEIFNRHSEVANRLIPGEQGIIRGNSIDVHAVVVDRFIAWKDGRFYFQKTTFEELMRQIARWYDVEIVYNSEIPQETFSGEMSRNLNLKSVLELLNVSAVQVRVEGRQLIVN